MAIIGRSMRIARDTVTIAGARSDSITVNNEPIDVTDKGDSGWRTVMGDASLRSISAPISGILVDATLAAEAVGNSTLLIKECVVTITGLMEMTGDFLLTSFEQTGELAEAIAFTATLENSGAVTTLTAPYATVFPVISGTPTVGQVLTGTTGTWVGTPSLAYVWQRSLNGGGTWTNIGVTTISHTLGAGDTGAIMRRITNATNAIGTQTDISNIIGPVAA